VTQVTDRPVPSRAGQEALIGPWRVDEDKPFSPLYLPSYPFS